MEQCFEETLNDLVNKPQEAARLFITGAAGTGKTYLVRQRPKTILTATTGIAAMNLGDGITTINSLLGFYDLPSLKKNREKGIVRRAYYKAQQISGGFDELAIDEISMMSSDLLDEIADVLDEFGCRLTLVGDFAQLPPITGNWAFKAKCWPQFEITKLTEPRRQRDPKYLDALNYARGGYAKLAVQAIRETPVKFIDKRPADFYGTVVFPKNATVDEYNFQKLKDIPGKAEELMNLTWGKPRGEWNNVPPRIHIKIGARVMVLVNDLENWDYVNGSTGVVEEICTSFIVPHIKVRLDSGKLVSIGKEIRYNEGTEGEQWKIFSTDYRQVIAQGEAISVRQGSNSLWAIGRLTWWPLRLAWATTVHKAQGLTLDRVLLGLVDGSGNPEKFFRSPNMGYVALTRVRTPEGLTIVGSPTLMEQALVLDPHVRQWI